MNMVRVRVRVWVRLNGRVGCALVGRVNGKAKGRGKYERMGGMGVRK
jgi:hypothetical protein